MDRISEIMVELVDFRKEISDLERSIEFKTKKLKDAKGYLKKVRRELIEAMRDLDPDLMPVIRDMIVEDKLEGKT